MNKVGLGRGMRALGGWAGGAEHLPEAAYDDSLRAGTID